MCKTVSGEAGIFQRYSHKWMKPLGGADAEVPSSSIISTGCKKNLDFDDF